MFSSSEKPKIRSRENTPTRKINLPHPSTLPQTPKNTEENSVKSMTINKVKREAVLSTLVEVNHAKQKESSNSVSDSQDSVSRVSECNIKDGGKNSEIHNL